MISEELKWQLTLFLASKGVVFNEVKQVDIDPDTGTLDISYTSGEHHRWDFYEMTDPTELLEFLVEKRD